MPGNGIVDRRIFLKFCPPSVLLFLLICGSLVLADVGGWFTSQGPSGAKINSLVIDPMDSRVMYIGSDAVGGHKSFNAGSNWVWMRNFIEGAADYQCLVVQPNNSKILYAGTASAGVVKSTDGGANWMKKAAGLEDLFVLTLAIDNQNPNILYAGTRSEGIFKTTNGGENWFSANTGFPVGNVVFEVAIHPLDSNTIFACTGQKGVYRSSDGGGHWAPKNKGLEEAYLRSVYCLDFDAQAAILYVGGWGHGVFKSLDGGENWSPANSGIETMNINDLRVAPSGKIYAGGIDLNDPGRILVTSDNGGASWRDMGDDLATPEIHRLALVPATSLSLYVASKAGAVYYSDDGGMNWQIKSRGFFSSIRGVAYGENDIIYAGSEGAGFFRRIGNSGPWVASSQGMTKYFINALAVDSSDRNIIYAAESTSGGVYKSIDGGGQWTPKNSGLSRTDITSVEIDPANSSHVLAGSLGAVFESQDAGETWALLGSGLPSTHYVWDIGFDGGSQVSCAVPGRGVYALVDGTNWMARNTGLPDLQVYKIGVCNKSAGVLFAGGNSGGLYRSANGGLSWTKTAYPQDKVVSLAVYPEDNNWVAAGAGWLVYLSKDNGNTWKKINHGRSFLTPLALSFHPQDPSLVMGGVFSGGVRSYAPSTSYVSFHFVTAMGQGGASYTGIRDSDLTYTKGFYAFPTLPQPSVQLAAGDLSGDGVHEILTGQGEGGSSWIVVYNQWGQAKKSFKAFRSGDNPSGEVHLATADIHGDGIEEILVSGGVNGPNFISFFSNTGVYLHGFRPWNVTTNPGGEVHLVTGDIDGDQTKEIICGQGKGGASWISIFELNGAHVKSFRPYSPSENPTGEVHVGVADIDGDGKSEILAGQGQYGISWVGVWTAEGKYLFGFRGFPAGLNAGGEVTVCGADLNTDGQSEIAVASGPNGANEVRIYSSLGTFLQKFQPFSPSDNPSGEVQLCLGLFIGY